MLYLIIFILFSSNIFLFFKVRKLEDKITGTYSSIRILSEHCDRNIKNIEQIKQKREENRKTYRYNREERYSKRYNREEKDFVYFMYSEEVDAIKIGVSKHPRIRLRQIRKRNHFRKYLSDVKIIKIEEGGFPREKELHGIFAESRIDGSEWFKPTVELTEYIGEK